MKLKQAFFADKSDVGDVLTAVEGAMSYITDAVEELRGLSECVDLFDALGDIYDEAERLKDKYESYMSGEYRAQIDELMREYYRDLI